MKDNVSNKTKEKKLNPRQKKFCLLRVSGMTQIEAYKKAGYKSDFRNACNVEATPEVSREIKRLQEKAEEKVFDLKKECQKLAPEVIDELLSVARNWNLKGSNSDKVSALRELLDRGFGKPSEKVIIEEHKILID